MMFQVFKVFEYGYKKICAKIVTKLFNFITNEIYFKINVIQKCIF